MTKERFDLQKQFQTLQKALIAERKRNSSRSLSQNQTPSKIHSNSQGEALRSSSGSFRLYKKSKSNVSNSGALRRSILVSRDSKRNSLNEIPNSKILKKKLLASLEEKKRVERINEELSDKLMTLMKQNEDSKKKLILEQQTNSENKIKSLENELKELEENKNLNEKKLLEKIIKLEQKLNQREIDLEYLGKGIEAMNNELQLRQDPSTTAIELVNYLETFSKQNEAFLDKRLREFKSEFEQLRRASESRTLDAKQSKEQERIKSIELEQIKVKRTEMKELVDLKNEESKFHDEERQNFNLMMEHMRYDNGKVQLLRKSNSEMVKSKLLIEKSIRALQKISC